MVFLHDSLWGCYPFVSCFQVVSQNANIFHCFFYIALLNSDYLTAFIFINITFFLNVWLVVVLYCIFMICLHMLIFCKWKVFFLRKINHAKFHLKNWNENWILCYGHCNMTVLLLPGCHLPISLSDHLKCSLSCLLIVCSVAFSHIALKIASIWLENLFMSDIMSFHKDKMVFDIFI